MLIVLGLGCDRGTSLLTLETAINQALALCQLDLSEVLQLATIDKKQDEPAILQLAQKYALPLNFYPAEQLAQVVVPSPSDVVLKYMGTPSVAEAAALLCAGVTMDYLVVEKYKFLGSDGKNATVSVVNTGC